MSLTAQHALPLVAARVAQEHNIFKTLVSQDDRGTSISTLIEETKLDPPVLAALLEYLATQDMLKETAPGRYAPTKTSELLLNPLFVDGTTHFHDNCLPAFNALNQYLTRPDFRSAFEIGHQSSVDFYTWLETHPVQSAAFHRFMEAQFASLPTWLDVVAFESEYAIGTTPETPIFVDVGGGAGQQIVALRKRFPSLIGKLILQDTPAVLQKAIVGSAVERIAYDYLTEQPVKGARVYYFRQIFHNNNDATCHKILESHLPAMGSDSVLLIDDKVLPNEKPAGSLNEYTAGLSLAMLVMFKALERKEYEWRTLLEKAGYKIKAIRKYTEFGDSIIVAIKR